MESILRSNAQQVFAAKNIRIPGQLLRGLQELAPGVDSQWKSKARGILRQLPREERRYVLVRHLEPKGIVYDKDSRSLTFKGRESLLEVCNRIQTAELKTLGQRLLAALARMRRETSAYRFARWAERLVNRAKRFDVNENLATQREKRAVFDAFLRELVQVTQAAKLRDPRSLRKLTAHCVKDFLVEVYIKHAMLGYRFRTVPVESLRRIPHKFISNLIARYARDRQCDVLISNYYLYLIAPEARADRNPFSVSRFLREETMMEGGCAYFNGIAVKLVKRLDRFAYQHHTVTCAKQMLTLRRQLGEGIVDLVNGIERCHRERIRPLLVAGRGEGAPVPANAFTSVSGLRDVERLLAQDVLAKVQYGLEKLASTDDDFEFLFVSLRQLMIRLAGDVRDFASRIEGARDEADNLELRIMAFLALMDRRKEAVFDPDRDDPGETNRQVHKLGHELIVALKDAEGQTATLSAELREEVLRRARINSPMRRFGEKLLNMLEDPVDIDELRMKLSRAKHRCFVDMLRILKRHWTLQVYLELAGAIRITGGERHYAIAQGANGLGRLPVLLRLHENGDDLDLAELKLALGKVL